MQTWQSSMYLQGKTIFSPSKRVMTMLSPSVSDIVVLAQGGKKTAYYTDSIGFKEVTEFLMQQRTQKKHKERGEAR